MVEGNEYEPWHQVPLGSNPAMTLAGLWLW